MAILNLTDRERNAPGGQSTMQGGAQSAYNPALDRQTTPAPTPVPTTPVVQPAPVTPGAAAQPSMLDQLAGIEQEGLRIQDILNQRQADEAAGSGFTTAEYEQEPEFKSIYDDDADRRAAIRNQRRLFQSEIDATNQVYDQLLNEARTEGQGRIGSQRAIAARGGLLGSDFAGAQKQKVQDFNTDIQRGIQAERAAAIGAIEGTVRSAVADELAAKREARQLGAEEYSDYLAGKSARKENYKNALIQDLLTQGINIEDLSEEELAQYLRPAGLKADDVKASYLRAKAGQEAAGAEAGLEARKTEAEIAKIEADIESGKIIKLPEGNMLLNLDTGEKFVNPKTYAPKSGSDVDITKKQGYTAAEQFIKDNPDATEEELRAGLLQYSDDYNLSVTDVNAILSQEGAPKKEDTKEFTPAQLSTIATKVRKAVADFSNNTEEELEKAKAYISQGKIKTGGQTYSLTQSQIDTLISNLDDMGERTLLERTLPGGQ